MALFTTDGTHAMIIVDIYWDAKGNPTQFRVAEANYGVGWNNPKGMVPWARTVRVDREISVKGYGSHAVKVVNLG